MVNARAGSATASLALEAQSVLYLENAIHLAHQMASAIQHPRSASARKASQVQLALLELMIVRMAAMEKGCASMGLACVAQDGLGKRVMKSGRNLGLLLQLHLPVAQEVLETMVQEATKVNRRSSQLEVGVQLRKMLLLGQRWQLAWAPPVEKAAFALGMARATQHLQSAIVTQAGMELSATPNIAQAGMATLVQNALAMAFATQETVSVPQAGGKISTTQTRHLRMCARMQFARLAAGTMACV